MQFSVLLGALSWAVITQAAYDQNRAGAVLKAPAGDAFKSVGGTFSIPTALTGDNRISIWVGIGDSLTQTYVLGGGVSFNKTLSTWSAFFPSSPVDNTSEVPVSGTLEQHRPRSRRICQSNAVEPVADLTIFRSQSETM